MHLLLCHSLAAIGSAVDDLLELLQAVKHTRPRALQLVDQQVRALLLQRLVRGGLVRGGRRGCKCRPVSGRPSQDMSQLSAAKGLGYCTHTAQPLAPPTPKQSAHR